MNDEARNEEARKDEVRADEVRSDEALMDDSLGGTDDGGDAPPADQETGMGVASHDPAPTKTPAELATVGVAEKKKKAKKKMKKDVP